jgi:dTDP-4-amino-4,6-dideoxygalactose transaminase
MPYYRQFGWKKGDFPEVEDYYEHCISLPIYPSMSDTEQDYVISKVKEYFAQDGNKAD